VASGSDELEAIELVRVRVPMRRDRRAAHGSMPREREVVLTRAVAADGAEGWGECSALESGAYAGVHTHAAWEALRDVVAPAALAGGRNRPIGHPMASAAVDVAVTDLRLRQRGVTLADALGCDPAATRPLGWTAVVGIHDTVDDALAEASEAIGRGASALKLKVQPGWDLEPVGAVRSAHPALHLAVDANGSYGRDDTERLVALARLLVEAEGYVEQPLAAEDLPGLVALGERLPVRVALDESIVSATDGGIVGALGARGLINVKPARLGGVSATRAFAELVAGQRRNRRPETFLGGMYETGVGRWAALTLGALTVTRAETDLGPSSWYFDDDLTDPVELTADERLPSLRGPGLTSPPRPERLVDVAVDRELVRR
jgi:O-succinylbenzoate synthase